MRQILSLIAFATASSGALAQTPPQVGSAPKPTTVTPAKEELLPAPVVMNQNREILSTISVATLRAGSRLQVSLKAAAAGVPAITDWTLYFVDLASGDIKWSRAAKGAPPETIEWDGMLDDGSYPEPGKTYTFKAVLRVGEVFRKTAACDVSVSTISTDVVEINSIYQHIGVGAFQFTASNGQKIPSGIAGYVSSRVSLGDIFELEMNAMKELKSTRYEPELLGERVVANVSVSEFIASLYLRRGSFRVSLGGGYFYQKANVKFLGDDAELPPDPEAEVEEEPTALQDGEGATDTTETAGQTELTDRDKVQAPAVALGAHYQIGDFTFGARGTASFSKLGPHSAYRVTVDYMLTRTWYVGTMAYLIDVGTSVNDHPGMKLSTIGLHVGFDLRRNAGI